MLGAIATKISQDCRTHPTGWLNVSEKFELGTCKIDKFNFGNKISFVIPCQFLDKSMEALLLVLLLVC